MKAKTYMKHFLLFALIIGISFSCRDNTPNVENLPSAPVAFIYKIVDNDYQLDYYVGAAVEFTSLSSMKGECVWDFGDGNTAVGEVVTHSFPVAGTFSVKLTIGDVYKRHPILIKDIVPIMRLDSIENEESICEVRTTPISISVELPNPLGLDEEFVWIFPDGTTDENDNVITTSTERNPGKMKFKHVGSQTVRLQVKLGGRPLEQGSVDVQVAFNEEVPTLYYAVKGGNVMALKLPETKPADMKISPYNMGVSSGKHSFNVLFNDESLYLLDAGQQFNYVNDTDGNLGDGRITVMSKDGGKVETMITNAGGAAFDDPFYGYIEGTYLYYANRNTGITKMRLDERNMIYSLASYPWHVQNALLGYYNNGWSYGAIGACFSKINDVWYWCKTYNGYGIYRFTDADILQETTTGGSDKPAAGIALDGMSPKSLVWDRKNEVIYFTIYDSGYEGLYRCTLAEFDAIGGSRGNLAPYKLKTANGKTVTPITEAGKGEGSSGEFIGICQLTLDETTGCVYFGLRSGYPDEVKSGLMRYNPATGFIEHVIEGIDVYGVAVNNKKSKLF